MDPNERRGWMEIVTVDDIDEHMLTIGQAVPNAGLVMRMLNDFPLSENSSILVPGAGTGQMFDYIYTSQLGNYKFMFTDLNGSFLNKLDQRLSLVGESEYETLVDDIEDTKLSGNYDGILAVMLLQHIDWRKGVKSMLGFNPSRLYFIIQEQNGDEHSFRKELPMSIKRFAETAAPCLVPKMDLIDYLRERNFDYLDGYRRGVPDDKVMVGLVFGKD